MDWQYAPSTVRIIGPGNKEVGTGILIAPGHILTCTHVAVQAQGGLPGNEIATMDQPIQFDLPLLPQRAGAGEHWAVPLLCRRVLKDPQVGDLSDIAILAIRDPSLLPDNACPAALAALDRPYGRKVMAYGFSRWVGDSVGLELLGLHSTGTVQVKQRPGDPEVLPGFSGAAVWDPETWAVLGMLVRRDKESTNRTVYMITAKSVSEVLKEARVDFLPFDTHSDLLGLNNVPPAGALAFVERSREMHMIRAAFQESRSGCQFVIHGMAGVGKTELALQYATLYRDRYRGGIAWLTLGADSDVYNQLVVFARNDANLLSQETVDSSTMTQVQKISILWSNWSRRARPALLIFDDVKDFCQLERYQPPPALGFHILITTRHKVAPLKDALCLSELTEGGSLKLLQEAIGEERINSDHCAAQQLTSWLGHLPLGIELVGRYLCRKPDLPIGDLLSRLQDKRLRHNALCDLRPGTPRMTASRGVYAALETTWDELDENARRLAYVMSLFAVAPIPWGLVSSCLDSEDPEVIEDIRDDYLISLSLLRYIRCGTYSIHHLIREFFRDKLNAYPAAKGLKQKFCSHLSGRAADVPHIITRKDKETWDLLVPHLEELIQEWRCALSHDDICGPYVALARYYNSQGATDKAESWYSRHLMDTRSHFSPACIETIAAINNLGSFYLQHRNHAKASTLLQEAWTLINDLPDKGGKYSATVLNNLALLYCDEYYISAATSFSTLKSGETLYNSFLEVLRIQKTDPTATDLEIATTYHNMSCYYCYVGDYGKARGCLQEALQIRLRDLGEQHLETANTLMALAFVLRKQARQNQSHLLSEAETLITRVLEIRQKLLAEQHQDIGKTLSELGLVLADQGDYAGALSNLTKAHELFCQALGPEDPLSRRAERVSGEVRWKQRRFSMSLQHRSRLSKDR